MNIYYLNNCYETYKEIYRMAEMSMTTAEFHPKRKKMKYYQKKHR